MAIVKRKHQSKGYSGGISLIILPILILLLTNLQSSVATDPTIVDNGDYTFSATWEFTDLTNYTMSNLTTSNGELNLTLNNYYWNQSNSSEFAKGQRTNVVEGDGIVVSSDDLALGYLQNPNFTIPYSWDYTNGTGSNVIAQWDASESGLLESSHPMDITYDNLFLQPNEANGIDTYINENAQLANYGGSDTLRVQKGVNVRRSILWFDLSSLSDAKVVDAQLQLYFFSSADGSFLDISAHRVTNSWVEMESTWQKRDAIIDWDLWGGDYDGFAFDTVFNIGNNINNWISWNITSLVDGWTNGTYENLGVLLNAPTGANTWKQFYASSCISSALRPILDITYYPLNTYNESATISQTFPLLDPSAYRDSSVEDFKLGEFDNTSVIPAGGGEVILGSLGYFKFDPLEDILDWEKDQNTFKNAGDFELSNTIRYEGSYSMKVWYNLQKAEHRFGVMRTTSGSWDWSGYTHLVVWARSYGVGEVMKVIIEDTGSGYEEWSTPLTNYWNNYTFPLAGFPGDISNIDTIKLHFTDYTEYAETYIDNITLLGGAPYFDSGTFTSQVFDGGYEVAWDKISWEEDKPAPTDIEVRTRTGNNPTPDGSWSQWSLPYSSFTGSNIINPEGRYIQYQVNLSTTDTDYTPRLYGITIVKSEYNMTFTYSVDEFYYVTWAKIFLKHNENILWEKVVSGTNLPKTITFDIGKYLYDVGDGAIEFGLTVNANSTNDVNISVILDDFQIKGLKGFYTSEIYDAGSEAMWHDVTWSADTPPTTNVLLRTRTSLDNVTWSFWSAPLAYPFDFISNPMGRYIQYKVNFSTQTLGITPIFKEINITYTKYSNQGTLTFEKDLVVQNVTNWGVLAGNCALNCQNIKYEYSIDSGINWNPLAGDLNLSSVSTSTNKIRFKVILETQNTSMTPTLYSITLKYSVNRPPVIIGVIPHQSRPEDSGPWSIDLTPYESDFEDSNLKLKWYMTGENTSLYMVDGEYSADDLITFTPQPDVYGNNQVTLWLEDSFGERTSQSWWINITSVNDAPEIQGVIPSYEKWENDPSWQLDLTGYKYDKDHLLSELSWSVQGWNIEPTPILSVGITGDIITFTLKPDSYGDKEITIYLVDSGTPALTDSQKIWINVTLVNKPPTINGIIPNVDMNEDDLDYVLDLTDYETDREDQGPSGNLQWTILGLNTSLVSASISDNNITFSLVPNAYGTNEVTIILEDSEALIDTQKIWINVTSENDAPVINGNIPDFDKNENSPNWVFDLFGYKYDVDNSSFDLSWIVQGWDALLFDNVSISGNSIIFNLAQDAYGNDLITINLTDGILWDLQTFWVNVTPINRPPAILGQLPSFDKNEDDPEWILDLTLNETDREDSYPSSNLVWSLLGVNNSLLSVSIWDNNITFTLVPNAFGDNEITIILTDSYNTTDTQHIWINVTSENDAPQIIGTIPSFEKLEDAPSWILNLSGYKFDYDNNDSELTWEISQWDAALFDLAIIGDEITFTPLPDAYGKYEMAINLTDGVLSDSQNIWINITSMNDAPSINRTISNYDRYEDDLSWTLDLTNYETDIEDLYPSQQLTWSVEDVDTDILSVTILDNNLTFTLKPDANGNNKIKIILADSFGDWDYQYIWVNVTKVNDAPEILGVLPSFQKSEDEPSWILNLSSYKSDIDNDKSELTWEIAEWDAALFDLIKNGEEITFTLLPDAYGTYEMTINLTDGEYIDSQNIWINVTPFNDAPVINQTIPNYDRNEDDLSWTLDLTYYETDIEDPYPSQNLKWGVSNVDSDLLSIGIVDNIITFTPKPNAFGNNKITIYLSDSGNLMDSQDIWVNVSAVNDAPVILGNIPSFTKNEDGSSWTLNLSGYKFDLDNNMSELNWEIAEWATALFDLSKNGDEFTFTLIPHAYGNYEMAIDLSDGEHADSQNIWINVTSINDAPQITGIIQNIQMTEDDPSWTLDLTAFESDIEDGTQSGYLTWSLSNVDASLLFNSISDNNITFTPLQDAFGLNYITITLTDSGGKSDSQIVLVEVISVNDPPVIQSAVSNIVFDEDTGYSLDLLGYGSDIEDSPDVLRWWISNANSSLYSWQIDPATNMLHINPRPDTFGVNYITLTLMDTEGAYVTQQLQIYVIAVNDNPIISPEVPDSLFETLEDEALSIILTGFENDIEDSSDKLIWDVLNVDTSKIKVSVDPVTDELIILPVVIFTPGETGYVEEEITLVLSDSQGSLTQQNVTVKIYPVNNAPVIEELPDLMIKFDKPYVFDFSPYVSDEDTQKNQLIITTSEPSEDTGNGHINVSGLYLNLEYPQSRVGKPFAVLITASDGLLSDYAIVQVTVSDHSPPELLKPIPNVLFDEDTVIIGKFNLDDYFTGYTDGSLNYSYYLDYSHHGDEYIFITIHKNSTVDLFSAPDWFGDERITFRAQDMYGAIAEYTIIVTVNPINDAPVISGVPDLECKINVSTTLDLSPYISDVDTLSESLIIGDDSPYVIPSGHTLIFLYNEVVIETVNIIVSDGFQQDGITINVIASINKYPVIKPIPDLSVGGGEVYLFSLLPYISDADNILNDLEIWTDSGYITPNANNNMLLQLDFPSDMIGDEVTVTVFVSDGLDTNSSQMEIRITDDLVPILIKSLPNRLFYEDTEYRNAINLNEYFMNATDYEFFGNEYVTIEITDDWVTLTAFENWSGTEIVTFRGILGDAFVEDTIEIVVKPVDDPPVLSPLPSFDKKINEIWNINLLDYIQDIDTPTTQMSISVDSPYVIQYATNIYFQYQYPIYDKITITVSDGINIVTGILYVNVTADNNAPTYVGLLATTHLRFGETWSIDLDDYFYDMDQDMLTFSCNKEDITINPITHVATWTPQKGESSLTNVIFSVSDGQETIESSGIDLVIEMEKSAPSFWEQFWWIFLLLALLSAILVIFAFKRREEPEEEIEYKIDEEKAVKYLTVKGGGAYIIKSDSSHSAYKVFSGLLTKGFEGLCITTNRTENLTERYDLGKAWIIKLTLRGQKDLDGMDDETKMMGLLAIGDEERMDDKYIFSSNFKRIVETIEEFLMGGDHNGRRPQGGFT
jgi:hypothetical protein